jgi:N-acetylglucosamine kinase
MEALLAIDGGGSRTRCLAIDRSGRIVGEGSSGPSNHLHVSGGEVVRSLGEATAKALARGGLGHKDVLCVSAGLAGVDYDGAGAREMEEIFRELGFARAVVNGDMVIAHAGALGGRCGVLALAGTGSSFLGVGPRGERIKVGGWGPIYGDEGSAYQNGQRAIIAAARAYDGRGPDTALLGAILRALGLSNFRETVARIYVSGMEPREIASLSRVAYEVAEAGDEVAREIFLRAGEELADGVEAAARQLVLGESEVTVSYQGAVLKSCALVRGRFSEELQRRLPGVSIQSPRFEPVIGAYLLGREALGWPADAGLLGALETRVSAW